jgi:hypothetical protein
MARAAVLDLTIIVLFLGLGPGAGTSAGPAHAQAQTPPQPTGEDKLEAKVYFERGESLKQSGRARADAGDMDGARAAFSEAAGLYLRAFRLFPHAAFVFNAAQMHRLSGESGPAIAAYEQYLEIDPEGAKAGEARTYITQLRRSQAARATAERNEDGEDAGDEDGEDAGGEDGEDAGGEDGEDAGDEDGEDAGDEELAAGDAEAGAASRESGELDDFDAEDEPARTGRPLRIAGLATVAAGAIGFGIGIKYGLDAQSIADDLSQPRSMWGYEERELYEDGERANRTALIFMGIGGAALVTGGVLYLVGHNRDSGETADTSLAVSASASPDGASMLLWGRF